MNILVLNIPDARTLGTVNALQCEMAAEVLRSTGSLRLRVTGWSMLPSIWPGDILTIGRRHEQVSAGDIVLFALDRRLFAHRVISAIQCAEGVKILTQGDGMPRPDPAFGEAELLGTVRSVLRNGKSLEPNPRPGLAERGIAALVRRSATVARVVAGVHSMRQISEEPVIPCQS